MAKRKTLQPPKTSDVRVRISVRLDADTHEALRALAIRWNAADPDRPVKWKPSNLHAHLVREALKGHV